MKEKSEIPKFQGIADPKCRCTTLTVCQVCMLKLNRFSGKFKDSWAEAVRKNNEEVNKAPPD